MGRRAQPRKRKGQASKEKRTLKQPIRLVWVDVSEANFDRWLRSAMRRVRPPRVRLA